jgi:hypothetical protein
MKKLILFLLIPFTALMIISCDSSDDPINPTAEGNIFVSSNPAGAEIWIDGRNTLKTTIDTIKNVDEGVHSITLKLQDYRDTTFSVSVTGGQTIAVPNITLRTNILSEVFGPIIIYETSGTGTTQPSGLDLSSGNAWGVESDSSGIVDIYYSTSGTGGQGYLVQSADLYTNLIRETDFFVSSATNLFDGADSPNSNTGTWTNNIGDREDNYVFLYDHDGHYSKLKIERWGGGSGPGDPAWVEVRWIYNKTLMDNRF